MDLYKKLRTSVQKDTALWTILVLAFFLRVVGIGYGLPLSIVADEATFTYGALLMIKLHTLLPAFHPEFQSILYYPPYLSYILVPPFLVILGLQYILLHGNLTLLQVRILQDPSLFFMTARLVSVLLGTFSVFLVYRIAERLFRSRVAAIAAAFLLATSISHEVLSMVGRQWLPVSAVLLFVLYILTDVNLSSKKRYLAAFAAAGIGMGISSICVLGCVLIGIYYLLFDVLKDRNFLRDARLFFVGSGIFVSLAMIAWLLYHGGSSFVGSITIHQPKSLAGFLLSPWSAVSLIVLSEPVLVALSVLGIVYCALWEKKAAVLIAGFYAVYVAVFYIFFRFESRFVLPLVPFLALLGGYAVARLWNRRLTAFVCIVLVVPLFNAVRLSYLAMDGDTREHARQWVLAHLAPSDRILVYSYEMRIPTQAAAVNELRAVDANALHQVDQADETTDRHDVPYTLNNLAMITDPGFFKNISAYARQHGYSYVLVEKGALLAAPVTTQDEIMSLVKNASVVAHFDGMGTAMSIGGESGFTQLFTELFQPKSLGPDIVLYRLQ